MLFALRRNAVAVFCVVVSLDKSFSFPLFDRAILTAIMSALKTKVSEATLVSQRWPEAAGRKAID